MASGKWTEPKTIEEARNRRLELQEAARSIEAQLAGDPSAAPDWRRRTLLAKNYKISEAAYLKNWIRRAEENITVSRMEMGMSPNDKEYPGKLILLAFQIINRNIDVGNLPEAELAVVAAIRQYLRNHAREILDGQR